jgi:hypothetical protein
MRLFVRCNHDGTILSVIKVHAMPETLAHPYAHPLEEGEQILEIDPDPGVSALNAHEVLEQYAVDSATGKLQNIKAKPT